MGKQDFIKLFRMLQISCMYKINTKINFTYIYICICALVDNVPEGLRRPARRNSGFVGTGLE